MGPDCDCFLIASTSLSTLWRVCLLYFLIMDLGLEKNRSVDKLGCLAGYKIWSLCSVCEELADTVANVTAGRLDRFVSLDFCCLETSFRCACNNKVANEVDELFESRDRCK